MNIYGASSVFLSVLYTFIFGVLLGALKVLISIILDLSEDILKLPENVYKASEEIKKLPSFIKDKYISTPKKSGLKSFIADFVFIMLYGVLFSILLYIVKDGEFRFYILALAIISSYLFYKYLGEITGKSLYKLLKLAICVLIFVSAPTAAFILFIPRRLLQSLKNKKMSNKDTGKNRSQT